MMATWEKWKGQAGYYVLLHDGRKLASVRHHPVYPRKWIVRLGGAIKADPTPFPSAEKARIVTEACVLDECRGCLSYTPKDRIVDGVCEDCGGMV
jgi:hypothetical protein